ncbi:hypothetical protein ACIQD5_35805 [Streptomyces microflavus]|uniref:hypothetical protein n=1 Tax=Streptomyces microflavus TaxID=1919 RepID=UPI0037F6D786
MTTTGPTPPTPTPATPSPTPAAAPVFASRRSVLLLAAAMGLLAAAGLLYVMVDRPGLREPLEGAATVMGAICAVGTLLWTVLEVRRPR